MAIRNEIRFLLNGRDVVLKEIGSSDTLLDFIRLEKRLTGTKEGCAEGDCGACTVLVGRLLDGELRYEAVNACIRLLASVDGCHVVTVEHVARTDGTLHPVQQALVDHHGSQCGFCTPGFVMSLYALWMQNPDPDDAAIETALQGNLCRCTGYEPIVAAAKAAATAGGQAKDALIAEREAVTARLKALRDGSRVEVSRGGERAILPASADDLADVLAEHAKATIVAGSTDVGLWITKFMRDISPAVFIGHLDELARISTDGDDIVIGAGVTYTQAEATIAEAYPHLAEFWKRIGGWQVRNMGTVGGNVANGSPIGDTPPILISLCARVVLRKGDTRRTVPLEDFFVAYGKQDREPGDFVEAIRLPRVAAPGTHLAAYKISKRRDEDISSVCGGFAVRVENGTITEARLAFGGMAATPKRAANAEKAMVGQPWSTETIAKAGAALSTDFEPISDWRASAAYRATVARNLLVRFYLEQSGTPQPARLAG
ncbi:MAG: xanthine dehydrogenase small subunit [Brucellaceae bacterium]|nr:xanthine dehydrogenase small subunit [Brucellaceae bacterium]